MAKLRGGDPQFTYDFGLAVSTQTISRLTRLTGATLSLAGAYYALQKTSSEYMDTLRSNSLRFGGYLNTMRAISEAQDRIIKGATRYSVKDQLKGLNDLMAVGLDARKEFDLVNKSAHALGVEFSDFAGAISNGIRGNMSALVQMGLLTERSVRYFEKYPANTIMRQQAILKFVKEHKGLQSLIKNDFKTIADETSRISTIWKVFLKSIVGDPRNPDSLYGSVVRAFGGIADGLKGYMEYIKRAGYMIGRVLGWVVRQVGKFVQWLGRTTAHAFRGVKDVLDNYKDATASIIVWLEFWKQRIVKFFREYQEPIKTTLKLLIAYKALKAVFVISKKAIASAWAYSTALSGGLRAPFIRGKWRTGRMIVNRRQQGSLVKQGIGRGSWGRRWMYLKNMFMTPSSQTKLSALGGTLTRFGKYAKGITGPIIALTGALKLLSIGFESAGKGGILKEFLKAPWTLIKDTFLLIKNILFSTVNIVGTLIKGFMYFWNASLDSFASFVRKHPKIASFFGFTADNIEGSMLKPLRFFDNFLKDWNEANKAWWDWNSDFNYTPRAEQEAKYEREKSEYFGKKQSEWENRRGVPNLVQLPVGPRPGEGTYLTIKEGAVTINVVGKEGRDEMLAEDMAQTIKGMLSDWYYEMVDKEKARRGKD